MIIKKCKIKKETTCNRLYFIKYRFKKVIINLTQKKHGCCQTQMNCAQVICSHISKKRPMADCLFSQTIGFIAQQSSVDLVFLRLMKGFCVPCANIHFCRSWFPIFQLRNSLNNLLNNLHHPIFGRKFFMYVVGQSTLKHF